MKSINTHNKISQIRAICHHLTQDDWNLMRTWKCVIFPHILRNTIRLPTAGNAGQVSLHCRIAAGCAVMSGSDLLPDSKSAIGHFWIFLNYLEVFCMKFLSNNYKKYIAAAATVFAAIAIPAQATDCQTACQQAANQAGQNAANQKAAQVQAQCVAQTGGGIYMGQCMNQHNAEIVAAGDQAYQQTYNSCMGSCH
jgi:hypothetical protein